MQKQKPQSSGLQQRQERPPPAGDGISCRISQRVWGDVGQGRAMVHLVQRQEGTMTLEFGKVQIRSGGNTLVGGDVALKLPARVRRIIRGSRRRHGRWQRARIGPAKASSAVSRRLSRGTTQQTWSMTPADNDVAEAMTGRRDLPPPGVIAARMSVMSAPWPAAMAWTIAAICA
jgi:hypothetical protein